MKAKPNDTQRLTPFTANLKNHVGWSSDRIRRGKVSFVLILLRANIINYV